MPPGFFLFISPFSSFSSPFLASPPPNPPSIFLFEIYIGYEFGMHAASPPWLCFIYTNAPVGITHGVTSKDHVVEALPGKTNLLPWGEGRDEMNQIRRRKSFNQRHCGRAGEKVIVSSNTRTLDIERGWGLLEETTQQGDSQQVCGRTAGLHGSL